MSERKSPLSQMLRSKADAIEKLLGEYEQLRYGDEDFRKGDKAWRDSQGKEGTPPTRCGKPPQILVVSSPKNIYYEEEIQEEEAAVETDAEEIATEDPDPPETQETQGEQAETEETEDEQAEVLKAITNPLLKAVVMMAEISPAEAHHMELDGKYQLLQELGVLEQYNCIALLPWARKLAAQLTYILETREIYSAEIKAVYPELLEDLGIARSTCDQLAYLLGKQNGVLSHRQFTEMLSKLLHYTEVSRQAALQLADQHEEFMGAAVSPLEPSGEVEWVMKEMEGKPGAPGKAKEEETKEEEEE